MRRKICLLLAVIMAVSCAACGTETGGGNPASSAGIEGEYYTQQAVENWYRADGQGVIRITPADVRLNGEAVTQFPVRVAAGSTLSFFAESSVDGEYHVNLKFAVEEDVQTSDILCDVSDQTDNITVAQLQLPWYDYVRKATDRNGNETAPKQSSLEQPVISPLLDYSDVSKKEAVWKLTAGEKTELSVKPQEHELLVQEILLCPKEEAAAYEGGREAGEVPTITVEAEEYALKSDSYIRATAVKDAALYPYDTYYKKINTIDGGTWNASGQKILWEFTVEEEGDYCLSMRCRQNTEVNKTVFRRIEIDGEVPFAQWEQAGIDYTGASGYQNVTLKADGQDAVIHLTKGDHTIAMTATLGDYEEAYNEIFALMSDVNTLGMELMKLTGGVTDKNRTWDMEEYMPDATSRIQEYADRADAIYEKLGRIDGKESVYAMDLTTASEKLKGLLKEPERIPGKTEEICRGDDSAAKYLGNVLSALTGQGLTVDRLYLHGKEKLPSAKVGFLTSVSESVKRFLWSFLPEASAGSISDTGEEDELQVWVGQTAMMVDVLQQLLDETYNKEHDTNIRLVVMPSEQKLVLANATGTNPDVVLCAGSGLPFTFAARGALKNLLDYEEFTTYYGKQYRVDSLVPVCYEDGVYGAVDSQNFQLLFYRKDILETLGLTVPETWDDVRAMMPVLLRNQMNFYIPVSTSVALKSLGVTSPFIYQHGGELYTEDGSGTAIDSENSIDAMTELTEFYRIYAMQQTVANFYLSFRYGEVPIGIGDFNTYLQLKMAAPELAGLWGVALCPGNELTDGTIARYQPAAATASMIFANTDKEDEAWEFLRWWLSEDTQYEYAVRRMSVFGSEYQWNTANLSAFSRLPFDSTVRKLAMEQWEDQREITPHPASYIVERELSDVWNDVVVDNGSLIESLDQAVLLSDREIARKLAEFGYMDEDGNLIRDYNTRILDMLAEAFEESR